MGDLLEELEHSIADLQFKVVTTSFSLVRALSWANQPDITHKLKANRWQVKVAQILAAPERVWEREIQIRDPSGKGIK